MKNAELAIPKHSSSSITTINLMKVLNEAFSNTKAKGSSTACILSLSDDILHAVNVGDSGSAIKVQLGNGSTSDDPNVAEKINVSVIAGYVTMLGTDGLFDNVHDFELEAIVNSGVDSWESDVA
ncbi:hypothetical protein KY290_019038 [Solanum tuberosum]|uniref:Protein phosphatase n=1 Tax=Solanum tuberosum TaxID=4113 RepID=A0ABQ7VFY1_SOLTU|nr:hypothetical protein KY290_019038 [Solanum tuberosum]